MELQRTIMRSCWELGLMESYWMLVWWRDTEGRVWWRAGCDSEILRAGVIESYWGLGVVESYWELSVMEIYRGLGVVESYWELGVMERYWWPGVVESWVRWKAGYDAELLGAGCDGELSVMKSYWSVLQNWLRSFNFDIHPCDADLLFQTIKEIPLCRAAYILLPMGLSVFYL